MTANISEILVVIPARAGSKGVPKKNSKPFCNGESLTERTIRVAKKVLPANQIVVSSDDKEVLHFAAINGIEALERPSHLATDQTSMQEVLIHCVEHYANGYKYLMLLQPTCPFRTEDLLIRTINGLQVDDDAVVGMNEAKSHPDFTLFKSNGEFVSQYGANSATRRQDTSTLLEVNGSIYLFNIESLVKSVWTKFAKIRPVLTNKFESFDIDTPEDWKMAELIEKSLKNV